MCTCRSTGSQTSRRLGVLVAAAAMEAEPRWAGRLESAETAKVAGGTLLRGARNRCSHVRGGRDPSHSHRRRRRTPHRSRRCRHRNTSTDCTSQSMCTSVEAKEDAAAAAGAAALVGGGAPMVALAALVAQPGAREAGLRSEVHSRCNRTQDRSCYRRSQDHHRRSHCLWCRHSQPRPRTSSLPQPLRSRTR
jgi:hypothetical protein